MTLNMPLSRLINHVYAINRQVNLNAKFDVSSFTYFRDMMGLKI